MTRSLDILIDSCRETIGHLTLVRSGDQWMASIKAPGSDGYSVYHADTPALAILAALVHEEERPRPRGEDLI